MGFTVLVVASTVFAIAAHARGLRGGPALDPARHGSWVWHPFVQLLLVCGLVFANQILCDAYILRVHGGDPRFIARFLGDGWFAISRDPMIAAIAAHVGDGRWLAPTVLRVQAFLELPFTLFAYLAVARLLGREVQRALVRPALLLGASAAFTIAFSLVELRLANPFTTDDLILRAVAMVVAPLWVRFAARAEGAEAGGAPRGLPGLANFLVGAAAIAALVLVVYDAFLLYNLAHLAAHGPVLAAALALGGGASWCARRANAMAPRASLAAIGELFASFTIVFFVPSLALRYWAGHAVTAVAGAAVIAAAIVATARRYPRAAIVRAVPAITVACCAGAMAAAVAAVGFGARLPEAALAVFVVVFLAVAIAVVSVWSSVGARLQA